MGAPSLSYREYAQVCSAYLALGSPYLSATHVQRLLSQRLRERNPELADKLSGLRDAEVRTLLLLLWRYQEGERLERLQGEDVFQGGTSRHG
jgi:hypothetical protein